MKEVDWSSRTLEEAQCGNSFGEAGTLKKHMLIHSREKSHKCTQCDYAASESGNLRRHIKTHSLEKPNKCKWCDFSSITKSLHICSPTAERSHITVKSAGAHSDKHNIWKPTSASTLEKNHLNANNAVTQVVNHLISNNIWQNIQQQLTSFFFTMIWCPCQNWSQ